MPELWGVLNVTPDSFSDGGRFLGHDAAVEHGRRQDVGHIAVDSERETHQVVVFGRTSIDDHVGYSPLDRHQRDPGRRLDRQ